MTADTVELRECPHCGAGLVGWPVLPGVDECGVCGRVFLPAGEVGA